MYSLESGESRNLSVEANGIPFWSPDSRFIGYSSAGKLKKIEATRMTLKGYAIPVADTVSYDIAGAIFAGFSASANGVLGFRQRKALEREIAWSDRAGKVIGTVGEPGLYVSLARSPDGTRLAVTKNGGGGRTLLSF